MFVQVVKKSGCEDDYLFSRCTGIRYSRFRPLMNYSVVSLETDIWVERKKVRCSRKKYIPKKQTELNELRQTVLLK